MIVGTLFEQLSEVSGINAFEKKREPVHFLRYELFDTYVNEYGPKDYKLDDGSWMDDLDEAA